MPAFTVLPEALVAAAAAVRTFSRDIGPPGRLQSATGSAELDEAVADFSRAWIGVARSLEERAASDGDLLQASAEHFGDLERRLVPRGLR